jgi:hypothetical protein
MHKHNQRHGIRRLPRPLRIGVKLRILTLLIGVNLIRFHYRAIGTIYLAPIIQAARG